MKSGVRRPSPSRTQGGGQPVVSVGLPVYNGEKYLAQALESLLAQDFEDFELIISDNASTDGTAGICERYASEDHRIRYHRQIANIGAAPNHNYVFQAATGRYFKWAAHDDECQPTLIGRCIEVLERRPEVVLVYPQAEIIDENGNVTGRYTRSIGCRDGRPHVRLAGMLRTIGLGTPMYGVFRSSTLRRTGLHGSFVSADLVLLAQVAVLGEIHQIPEPLLRKRFHPGRSQEAHQSEAEQLSWLNPRNVAKRHRLSRRFRLTLQYAAAVWHLSEPLTTRVACALQVVWQRHRARRLRQRLRGLLSSTRHADDDSATRDGQRIDSQAPTSGAPPVSSQRGGMI